MPRLARFVIDASVFVKWFSVGEEFLAEALALRQSLADGRLQLVAPDLIVFETCNAIRKSPSITDEDARLLAREVLEVRPEPFELNADTAEQAMTLARREGVSFYDASYIMAAKTLGCTLITADEKQLEAARKHVPSKHLKDAYLTLP